MNNILRKKKYHYKVNQIRTKLMGFYLEIDIFLTILSADEYWCKARNSHPHDQNLHVSLELPLIFLCIYVLYWPSSLMEISVFFFFLKLFCCLCNCYFHVCSFAVFGETVSWVESGRESYGDFSLSNKLVWWMDDC